MFMFIVLTETTKTTCVVVYCYRNHTEVLKNMDILTKTSVFAEESGLLCYFDKKGVLQ